MSVSIASEFTNYGTNDGDSCFQHDICGFALDHTGSKNLQEILTALFEHANECAKERNPPTKRKLSHGSR